MSIALKICGIRRLEDVQYLNQCSPDYAGFILSPQFWRYVPLESLQILSAELDSMVKRVGVFVNPTLDEIEKYAMLLDVIQLHGEEIPELILQIRELFPTLEIWKAVRVRTSEDITNADKMSVDKLVLDSFSAVSHGGTGTLAPWDIIKEHRSQKPFFLAGGISAENVLDAIEAVNPYGIDVSSSVETDKCKDSEKIRNFIDKLKFEKEG